MRTENSFSSVEVNGSLSTVDEMNYMYICQINNRHCSNKCPRLYVTEKDFGTPEYLKMRK